MAFEPMEESPTAIAPAASARTTAKIIFFMFALPFRERSPRPMSRLRRIKMRLAAIVGDTIACFRLRFTSILHARFIDNRIMWQEIVRADRRLAGAAGNIENIVRLTQSGHPAPQRAHQVL